MSVIAYFLYTLVTSTISGALGMGGGVILMVVFLATMPTEHALILHGLTQASSNGFRAIVNRENIDWKISAFYLMGSFIAYIFFYYLKFYPSKKVIYIIIGLMPFLSLFKKSASLFDINKRGRPFISGVVVSASQALAGVSGGVLDLFYLSGNNNRFMIVATKATTQTFGHIIKTLFFIQLYDFKVSSLPGEVYMVSFIVPLLGAIFGKKILYAFSDRHFIRFAKASMLVLSVTLLYKGILL